VKVETISGIIGVIYDCVLEPDRWLATLPNISRLTQSAASSIVVHDRQGSGSARVFECGPDQSYLRLYFERLAAMKLPSKQQAHLGSVGDVTTMTMLCGEREPLHSDFYVHWVKPLGFRDMIGVLVLRSGKRVAWFSVARSEIQMLYSDRDARLMGMLSPHICRAFLIADALDLQTVAVTRLEETVDALSTGVVLTERQGRIAYMNGSAERLLKAGNALRVSNGCLTAARPRARDALSKALASSVEGKAPTKTGRYAVALPDDEGSGLIASVLPLQWRESRNPLSPLPGAAAVIVQDPADPPPLPDDAFAELYGLTLAERRVLRAVAQGLGPQDAADALGVSLTTIRTHLQNLFAKTGTTRQADLVRRLMTATPPVKRG
jgi:DNA-binding CsgD family transcriptional regulator/PAS domain-containing protein